MNDQELEALCFFTLSQDESNHELFHMYPLEDKLKALDYFWEHVANKLPYFFVDRHMFKSIFTNLPFKSGLYYQTPFEAEFYPMYTIDSNRYVKGKSLLDFKYKDIKGYFIDYVTNYHNSINQKHDS